MSTPRRSSRRTPISAATLTLVLGGLLVACQQPNLIDGADASGDAGTSTESDTGRTMRPTRNTSPPPQDTGTTRQSDTFSPSDDTSSNPKYDTGTTTTDTGTTPKPDTSQPKPDPCQPTGQSYSTISVESEKTDRPPSMHADLNIHMRSWTGSPGTTKGLVDVSGPTDPNAKPPQLNTLFTDDRVPTITKNYKVGAWDWGCNCRNGWVDDWPVTMSGFATQPGEVLEVPDSGYDIGGGNEVMVLYADHDSITLKYTREDNVVKGYTIHAVGVCVDPNLKSLYDQMHAQGRGRLPTLRGNQAFGRARGSEVKMTIRDTGRFMDPRVRKDWWEWGG